MLLVMLVTQPEQEGSKVSFPQSIVWKKKINVGNLNTLIFLTSSQSAHIIRNIENHKNVRKNIDKIKKTYAIYNFLEIKKSAWTPSKIM